MTIWQRATMGEDEVFELIATEFTFATIYTTSLFSYSILK
jgi:hypothetical protein